MIGTRQGKEISMRKVIASELVSWDGVMEAPETWHLPYFNDEMGEAIGAVMAEADAMLFGRVTYQEFAAFWPNQSGDDQEFADYMKTSPSSSSRPPSKSPSSGTTRR
jgi:hypothetical protein